MTTTLTQIRPLPAQAYEIVRPGMVGSVGDVLGQIRVKQSSPDMPFAWDPIFSGVDEPFRGSNVQNGTIGSWTSDGMSARTIDRPWTGRKSFKTAVGWVHQDISAPDKMVTPVFQSQPSYSWVNRQAQVKKALVSGENFLPLPGGYQPTPGQIPRGGAIPRITDVSVEDTDPISNALGGSFLDAAPTRQSFFEGPHEAPVRQTPGQRAGARDSRRNLESSIFGGKKA